jgi:dolichol-phosphate mannosyltransferase
MKKIAVVIPVFNEGESLRATLPEISMSVFKIDRDYRVIYVDDGSTDNSLHVLRELKESEKYTNLEILSLPINNGYGGALRSGAELANQQGFWGIVFMDSDLTNPPSEIPQMIQKLEFFHLVKASRYVKGSDASEVSLQRRIYSVLGNLILRFLFLTSTRDITNGFRAWRLQEFLSLDCKKRGFDSIIEEFYQARIRNFQIAECPSVLRSRGNDLRESSSSYSLKALLNYLKPGILYFFSRVK